MCCGVYRFGSISVVTPVPQTCQPTHSAAVTPYARIFNYYRLTTYRPLPASVTSCYHKLQVVELLMHRPQMWVGDMGVYLGGSDIAMAQHGLHATQVGTVHQ